MLEKLYCIDAAGVDPYENLALEQALMAWLPENSAALYLWQNRQTVVIGRNQNAWKECRTELLKNDGGHLARRLSGGGAVYHDLGNLNFTFLAGKDDYSVEKQLSVILHACRALGIPAEKSGRNDLLVDGKKFSGNAFLQTGGKGSHHGTLLVDVDMAMLTKYLRPSAEKLKAKGVESVASRVTNLRAFCPDLTVEALRAQLKASFEAVYGGACQSISPALADVGERCARLAAWDWIYGAAAEFPLRFGARFSWGEVELRLQVRQGRVADVKCYTDALDWQLATRLERALTGARVDLEALQAAVRGLEIADEMKTDLLGLLQRQQL